MFNILLIALTKPLLYLLPPTVKNVILIILALPLVVHVLGLSFASPSA